MPTSSAFTLFNASAGSGKTFNLVKDYLFYLLKHNRKNYYRQLLAITFTNKAVGEMKSRIIQYLKLFSNDEILNSKDTMLHLLKTDLDLSVEEIHKRSKDLLNHLLHNYAGFDVTTIDGFTHRLIRTFAFDLNLPINFEVELDAPSLLKQAVDRLIAKAGSDPDLTKVLIDFALEKTNDDKSWDISYDFNAIAKSLINENDVFYLNTLKTKTLTDFKALKTFLLNDIENTDQAISKLAVELLQTFSGSSIEKTDFPRGSLFTYFEKLSQNDYSISFDLVWQNQLGEKPLYKTQASESAKMALDRLEAEIIHAFNTTKQLVFHLRFRKNILKNITPLSVLFEIQNSLTEILTEQNKLLISDFNTIISNEIKAQPTPYIYERIGEKYTHFFIDEFQDTSILQWENLIPLLQNALSDTGGTALLVGDAKQAIYRWRGGKPEQFINLFNATSNPFQQKINLKPLNDNFRSSKTIVNFNNAFFKFVSSVFSDDTHRALYLESTQNINIDTEGYLAIQFLTFETTEERDLAFSEQVISHIKTCVEKGFEYSDICVLTRFSKDAVTLSKALNDNSIPMVSSKSLLLSESEAVSFVLNMLRLLENPEDKLNTVEVLQYLSAHFAVQEKHAFISDHIHLSLAGFFKALQAYNIQLDPDKLKARSLYAICEQLITAFNLIDRAFSHVQFLLDVVVEYSQKEIESISGFLNYFETNTSRLSVVSGPNNAVNLMTIHSSKGLEFPVVIFPYADLKLHNNRGDTIWYPTDPDTFNGFSNVLINLNNDLPHYGDTGKALYALYRSQEELDVINLLYVALTRASEQLYVLTASKQKNTSAELSDYADLFSSFLSSQNIEIEEGQTYTKGNPKKQAAHKAVAAFNSDHSSFVSTLNHPAIHIITKSVLFWDETVKNAIEKGNLIHSILSEIPSHSTIDDAFSKLLRKGMLTPLQKEALYPIILQLVNHPKLELYFSDAVTVYNELDLITPEGQVLRPDRLVELQDATFVIIDYKTGTEKQKDVDQVNQYEHVINAMGKIVSKKLIVYINPTLTIKEF